MHGRVQVISWSNEEGREQTRCHLSLPPFHNDGTGFGAALDEMANRPHIMDWQVGGETRLAAVVKLIRSNPGTHEGRTAVSEFCEWKQLIPLLASMSCDEDSKHRIHITMNPLRWRVHLRCISRAILAFDLKQFIEAGHN